MSSATCSLTGGPALQDRTNTQPGEPEGDARDEEIQHLKALLQGLPAFSQDAATDDEGAPRPKKNKTKASSNLNGPTDYIEYGRIVRDIIEYGTTADAAMSGDEAEVNERLAEGYEILWHKFPGFREFLLKLTNRPVECRAFESQLHASIEAVRSDDTATLKSRVHLYLLKDPSLPLEPPLANLKEKTYRGRAHPVFARLLMPIDWPADDATTQEILEGQQQVTGTELPRLIFPLDQEFPVDEPMNQPVWLPVLNNALTSEVCLRSAKALMMGPDSALERDGYHKGRAGKASIIGLQSFTRRVICWIVTQVHFVLTSKQDWHKIDGDFNYKDFYWTIYGLFDDEEFAQKIIDL
ncbi:hypothetical protein C8R45DRAFT_1107176 [Mycena sanguinolenta]|nr:hypothetical protein C8R45DRAFT_1107176 [Mycena sanguinolenta]